MPRPMHTIASLARMALSLSSGMAFLLQDLLGGTTGPSHNLLHAPQALGPVPIPTGLVLKEKGPWVSQCLWPTEASTQLVPNDNCALTSASNLSGEESHEKQVCVSPMYLQRWGRRV
jgi:hypothetical protein